jgi:hypothetical protein
VIVIAALVGGRGGRRLGFMVVVIIVIAVMIMIVMVIMTAVAVIVVPVVAVVIPATPAIVGRPCIVIGGTGIVVAARISTGGVSLVVAIAAGIDTT